MYLKLVYNGKKVETRLPDRFDVTQNELHLWDKTIMQFRFKQKDARNTDLKEIQVRFEKYMRDCNDVIKHSLKQLMAILLDKSALYNNWSVSEYCDYYIENRVTTNIKLSKGTKINYLKATKHLKNFLSHSNLTQLPLEAFKHKEAVDFEIYMGSVAKNAPSSTSTNIIRLKTIFSEAINEELISKNPFLKLKLRYRGMSKTPCLTIDQVMLFIDNEKINADNKLKFYSDMFLFGCFTGLSVNDIITLSYDEIFPIYNDKLKIDTFRNKTKHSGTMIIQIMTEAATHILNKYACKNTAFDSRVFPRFSADDFREKLKIIAAIIGLNINLITKISRTTCNQLIINVGGFDLIYKRAFMGWSNLSDIQNVYTTMDDQNLLNNTKRYNEYLYTNLGNDFISKI
jgi:site-specific recombinase XerD